MPDFISFDGQRKLPADNLVLPLRSLALLFNLPPPICILVKLYARNSGTLAKADRSHGVGNDGSRRFLYWSDCDRGNW